MRQRTRDEHFEGDGPKRILCLDGGGLRGSLTLGILKELERSLRLRCGDDPRFRLSDYFDLIAGTSTGAIIAAKLALGNTVEDIYGYYGGMGEEVFKTTLLGRMTAGLVRPRYDRSTLERHLKAAVGETTRLGDESLRTGLLIVAKRIDSHSVWTFNNNPKGRFFEPEDGPSPSKANKEYALWKLLRASAAAPTYFDPVEVDYKEGAPGNFIDGGMSPFNDPSLQALMYATLKGYRVCWETGADNLLLVSVGTGTFEPPPGKVARGVFGGVRRRLGRLVEPGKTVKNAFFSLLYDNQKYAKALMQWLSSSSTASEIDLEMGALDADLLGGRALLSYVRLDAELTDAGLKDVEPELSDVIDGRVIDFDSLTRMDESANIDLLWRIGRATGVRLLEDNPLPPGFDIEGPPPRVFRVGIVGHRDNVLRASDVHALETSVAEVLARIARALSPTGDLDDGASAATTLCVVSALAEGADRIGARVALDARYALECPLPFDRDEYERDFRTTTSRREFRTVLGKADVVWELSGRRNDAEDAYARVGEEVVARSDVLVAIWDGEEARGRGGTAEVVQAAAARIPVVWISPDPAVEIRILTGEEGLDRRIAEASRLEDVIQGTVSASQRRAEV